MVLARAGALLIALAAAAVLLTPAHAAILPGGAPEPAASPSEPPAQAIDSQSQAGSDVRIASRIRGIFGAVPSLAGVTVSVSEGVVTLGGTVATADDIDRAEQIASRVLGVVTVENAIDRDLSFAENIGSLGGFSQTLGDLVKMLPLIGVALLLAVGIALVGYLLASLTWLWQRLAPNGFLAELIASAIRFAFVIGGIVIALQTIGAGALVGAVLGGAGIIGIALGFAMRDTIENYVASIMLSVRQPFRANDWVVIDEYEGRVIRLTSRATILMTLDGNHLRIPNSTVFKAIILNYTRNPQRRFDFDLGIDANDDPTAARRMGIDVLKRMDFVLNDPPPAANVVEVGDSNIVIKFLGWIDQDATDWFKARSNAIPAVKNALEKAGFALPEPIYRLRFDQAPPAALPPPAPSRKVEPAASRAASAEAADEHVGPENEIAEMVEAERRGSSGQEKDLLDSRRPVE